jgi:hypothetical protein
MADGRQKTIRCLVFLIVHAGLSAGAIVFSQPGFWRNAGLLTTHKGLCVATKAPQPFEREGWIFELKYDGFRILASCRGKQVALRSRRGTGFTAQFPEIAAELAALPDVVLDCELVMLDTEGVPRFERLVRRSRLKRRISIEHAARTAPAVLYAFDLLELRRRDLRERSLMQRKTALTETVAAAERIRAVGHHDRDGVSCFGLPPRWNRRHRREAGRVTLPRRPLLRLGQDQDFSQPSHR